MENKNMRKLNVTVQCMAVYNSSIMVRGQGRSNLGSADQGGRIV